MGWRDRALTYADSEHMFSLLHQTVSGYSGSFVSFDFNDTTATLSRYIVLTPSRSTLVFDTVTFDAVAAGVASINGSVFRYLSAAADVLVCNNPTSALVIKSGAATVNVTFTLTGSLDADRNGQSLNLSAPGLEARLLVTGAASLTLVSFDATAHLPPGTSAIFRANAMAGESVAGAYGQEALANATVRQLLALESFGIGLEGFIEVSDSEYGAVKRLNSTKTLNGAELGLQASFTSPKLVAFHLHSSILSATNSTQITVTLDDIEIPALSSLDELVEYHGATPAHAYAVGGKGLLLLIYMPQHGNHTLSVEKVVPPPEDKGLNTIQILAIIAVILVILGIAATLMVRRKPRI